MSFLLEADGNISVEETGDALKNTDFVFTFYIFLGYVNKALEKASKNKMIIDAIGEPVIRGPWYNASLAVAHQRQSVSCTFPVSGPQGTGIFQLKAVRNGDTCSEKRTFSILDKWSRDWEILIMEALVHVPGNEEKQQTFRIKVSDYLLPPASNACRGCTSQESSCSVEKK
ncbi:uncharacterized protein LOC132613346 [Lycium barbarum]|uniref:uncharacterized protein LOC132613346 n=1 Tax=Lycium barbarum TaxID=112863 RepID=UPI00293E93D8|nr:uncharacterized protein LOC132613346 [Lycium barbarum]